jgi:hypothetical protein
MSEGVERRLLCRRWVHAHEEDTDREMVFRPAEADLPPSRGRVAFELHEDGTFSESGIGPTDRPDEAGGRWTLEEGERVVLGQGAPAGVPRVMRVSSVDEERLVVER